MLNHMSIWTFFWVKVFPLVSVAWENRNFVYRNWFFFLFSLPHRECLRFSIFHLCQNQRKQIFARAFPAIKNMAEIIKHVVNIQQMGKKKIHSSSALKCDFIFSSILSKNLSFTNPWLVILSVQVVVITDLCSFVFFSSFSPIFYLVCIHIYGTIRYMVV